mmetsp:Transcript_47362/g.148121  ORF Transcript_47362/g.148121 Transcript_47362/m.148121 type:complete len:164 (+) Transcript_47362:225-716(+)
MTLDSSRTHRSDPEGLIQSYVLRVEEKNRLAESEWKKESASCFHADSLPDSQHIRSKKPRKPRRWQMRRSGRGRGGEWSKFDSSGSQTQGGMGSDRLLSLPERGEQEDRAATDGLVLPAAEGEREEAEPTACPVCRPHEELYGRHAERCGSGRKMRGLGSAAG